jgi:hypothetical protein
MHSVLFWLINEVCNITIANCTSFYVESYGAKLMAILHSISVPLYINVNV